MNIISSDDEDGYYGNIDYTDSISIYDSVEDYFLNYYGFVDDDYDDDEIIIVKKIIKQWRM